MKKSIISKLGVAAVMLTLVTGSLVGGTFAKYTSTFSGTGTATVAKWNVALDANGGFDETNSIVIKGDRADGKIFPGESGSFTLGVDAKDTEVNVEYKITLTPKTTGENSIPIKLYTDDGKELTTDDPYLTGTIMCEENPTKKNDTKTIHWKWENADVQDETDTKIGEAAGELESIYDVSITVNQIVESSAPAAE